jgi:hypothetical protein
MTRQITFLVLMLLGQTSLLAQHTKEVSIQFDATFGNQLLQTDFLYFSTNNSDTFQFEVFKFYISSVQFLQNEKIAFKENTSYHLIDLFSTEMNTLNITLPEKIDFNQVQFKLGIDSVTNASGALGGDLDPTKGMYWTWQNGYINFKLEGTSSRSTARKNEFEFHLGGYAMPFATCQTIAFIIDQKKVIKINVDVQKLMNDIDLSTFNHLMSPGVDAVKLSEKAKTIFSLQQ